MATHPSRLSFWKHQNFIPDEHITWFPNAYLKGLALIKKYNISHIISSSPSESNHLVALWLKQACPIHWIADFRDGWLFESLRPQRHDVFLRKKIETQLEKQVIRSCDVLTTVNHCLAADFVQRYQSYAAKIRVISNGFDANLFANIAQYQPSTNKFRIIYTGNLSLSRQGTSLNGFIQALALLRISHPKFYGQIRVELYGNFTENEYSDVMQSDTKALFTIHKPVSGVEYANLLCQADVLLLIVTPNAKCISTSKIYDYIASGRPILALAKGTSAGDLVDQNNLGVVVDGSQFLEIGDAICSFIQQKLDDQIYIQNSKKQMFEWQTLAYQMSSCLQV